MEIRSGVCWDDLTPSSMVQFPNVSMYVTLYALLFYMFNHPVSNSTLHQFTKDRHEVNKLVLVTLQSSSKKVCFYDVEFC